MADWKAKQEKGKGDETREKRVTAIEEAGSKEMKPRKKERQRERDKVKFNNGQMESHACGIENN